MEREMTYKKIAIELWKLLDNIDTASDVYKPKKTAYYHSVTGQQEKRFKYLGSDGYTIKRKWRKK